MSSAGQDRCLGGEKGTSEAHIVHCSQFPAFSMNTCLQKLFCNSILLISVLDQRSQLHSKTPFLVLTLTMGRKGRTQYIQLLFTIFFMTLHCWRKREPFHSHVCLESDVEGETICITTERRDISLLADWLPQLNHKNHRFEFTAKPLAWRKRNRSFDTLFGIPLFVFLFSRWHCD